MESVEISRRRKLHLDLIFAAILLLYPMRHIAWGLDLWDTGYNYANFTYMGLEHMDPMWMFSTYLATAVGHFLTLLPGAGRLIGMNVYTGLFVSGLAVGGYFFCTRTLRLPRGIAFVGEMTALSLCWCPTALLYNYITYVFLLICVIFLYRGLTAGRMWCLFGAGVCLGANVLVRFSNLPEAALIAAVWAWDVLLWRESRKAGGHLPFWRTMLRHTLWCLGGYLAALAALFGYLHIRYGLGSYIAGITRLFAMTEDAQDYTPKAMLMGLFGTYVENLYWVFRFGVIILAGVAGFAVLGLLRRLTSKEGTQPEAASGKMWNILWRLAQFGWCGVGGLMLIWLYRNGTYSFRYYSYDCVVRPATLFLMLSMLIAGIRIFYPGSPKEEKLISGLVILVVLITSIGSNNGVYPSINNLFVAAPYTLWECWRFVRYVKGWKLWEAFPVKVVLVVFLAVFLVQSAAFGACFVFVEATGARNVTAVIENNDVLRHIRMAPERAGWMEELSAYVSEQGLQGREVILFGQIPSLSYYLQMPSAFNPWSDLRSYSAETMRADLAETEAELASGGERPVMILERESVQQYETYLAGGETALTEMGVGARRVEWIVDTSSKYLMLRSFAERFNYDLTFENDKFLLYE